MASPPRPITETRADQMFPSLEPADIDRLRRFGSVKSFPAGEYLSKTGEAGPGMFVILSGEVAVTQGDAMGNRAPIVTHGPNSFMAEIAMLSGSPAPVDGIAQTQVEAIVIPSRRLRDLMMEEADLGERVMRALILRRVGLIQSGITGPVIVGRADDADVLRLEDFLSRNGHPHHWLDSGADEGARAVLERFHIKPEELPIVLCPNGQVLRNPSENALAQCLGIIRPIDFANIYDVAIVGAGPAGLAAAVYAGSEGLSTIMLDCRAFGGQAGASSRIENYLGFPTGITGQALMGRAFNQAQKFGVEMSIPDEIVRLRDHPESGFVLETIGEQHIHARSVVIATGAQYRRLDVANIASFQGSHVHYWASPAEARLCAAQEVVLVGAGNSAGQAAVYLARHTSKVWMLVRGKSLEATMSRYLINRINAQHNIEVVTETEVSALEGEKGRLQTVRWRHRRTGEESARAIRHVFLFIGAEPNASWLKPYGVAVDAKGFICTNIGENARPLETSQPGVFAIGDVRSGSVKRVASSVGEGAQVIATVHTYLAEMRESSTKPETAHG